MAVNLGHLRRESAAPGARRDVSGVGRWVDDMRTMLLARRTRPVELEEPRLVRQTSSARAPLDVKSCSSVKTGTRKRATQRRWREPRARPCGRRRGADDRPRAPPRRRARNPASSSAITRGREDPLGQEGHLPVGGGLAVGDPGGHAARRLFGRELAPLVDVPDLDEVPLRRRSWRSWSASRRSWRSWRSGWRSSRRRSVRRVESGMRRG